MSPLASGDIVPAYPYLWRREGMRGEDAGRKSRPACVALAVRGVDGLTHLALLPITGTAPAADQRTLAVPPGELRRIGLQPDKPGWIVVSEYNYDVLERSYSLKLPKAAPKRLSPDFLRAVLAAFRPTLIDPSARIDRR
jgi:hypothetical protein